MHRKEGPGRRGAYAHRARTRLMTRMKISCNPSQNARKRKSPRMMFIWLTCGHLPIVRPHGKVVVLGKGTRIIGGMELRVNKGNGSVRMCDNVDELTAS